MNTNDAVYSTDCDYEYL